MRRSGNDANGEFERKRVRTEEQRAASAQYQRARRTNMSAEQKASIAQGERERRKNYAANNGGISVHAQYMRNVRANYTVDDRANHAAEMRISREHASDEARAAVRNNDRSYQAIVEVDHSPIYLRLHKVAWKMKRQCLNTIVVKWMKNVLNVQLYISEQKNLIAKPLLMKLAINEWLKPLQNVVRMGR